MSGEKSGRGRGGWSEVREGEGWVVRSKGGGE